MARFGHFLTRPEKIKKSLIDALDVPYVTPSALIVYLFDKKILSRADAKMYINNLKEMVSEEEYYLAMREVE